MTTSRKLMIATAGVLTVALLGPIVITTLSPGGKRYFEGGRCACGYDSYIFLQGNGYFSYSPEHGYPPQQVFNLRHREGEWEMLALGDQSGGRYVSLGPAEGTVVGHLRVQDGALWEQWSGKTNWTRHARIYNPWPIWLAKLRAEPPPKITCVNNLKQIGLALRQWALDNGSQFPFNVSTNAGGTMELCAVGSDRFDKNAAFHFQVMSNELNTPLLLICPKDHSRKAATGFSSLQASNVTYRMRSGANLTDTKHTEALVVCPIDGNTVYCDGSVKEGENIQR